MAVTCSGSTEIAGRRCSHARQAPRLTATRPSRQRHASPTRDAQRAMLAPARGRPGSSCGTPRSAPRSTLIGQPDLSDCLRASLIGPPRRRSPGAGGRGTSRSGGCRPIWTSQQAGPRSALPPDERSHHDITWPQSLQTPSNAVHMPSAVDRFGHSLPGRPSGCTFCHSRLADWQRRTERIQTARLLADTCAS